jgi:DNA modification methylase
MELPVNQIICGDCLEVMKDWPNNCVDLVLTDPPYGIKIDTTWLTTLNVKRGKKPNMSDDKLVGDDGSLDLSFLWEYPKRIIFGHPYIYDPQAIGWLVWDKQPKIARRGIVSPVELASTTCWKGFDVIRCMWGGYMRESGEKRYKHPTQKPLRLIWTLIKENSHPNNLILDPFCGSGTTCVAAKMLGRRYIGIDISEKYCEIARMRLKAVETGVPVKEQLQGQQALFE